MQTPGSNTRRSWAARALVGIPLFTMATAASALFVMSGCGSFWPGNCDTSQSGNPLVPYTGGTTENGVYMSSPWNGSFLFFPGGMRYELHHDLGTDKIAVQVFLAFKEYGATLDGGSTIAFAAGNQAVIESVTDTTITIRNDSCSEYWVLVTAAKNP